MNTLFRCIDCNIIYAATPFDQTPEYLYSELENEYCVKEKNDWDNFENRHKGHQKKNSLFLIPLYTVKEHTLILVELFILPQRIERRRC